MPVDTFQLKSVAIKCLQGCWGPRHEKINGVSHSKITHCAVLISVSVMIARKYKYWFWYCIRNNLAISKYSISNPNQRLSHNSVHRPIPYINIPNSHTTLETYALRFKNGHMGNGNGLTKISTRYILSQGFFLPI